MTNKMLIKQDNKAMPCLLTMADKISNLKNLEILG